MYIQYPDIFSSYYDYIQNRAKRSNFVRNVALVIDQCRHFPSYDASTMCFLYLVFQETLLCLASHSDHLNLEIHETLKRH